MTLHGLCWLQLSEGLSSEYIKKPSEAADEKAAKFHADRQIYSKYYVNQILQQNEEGLRDAWSKVRLLLARKAAT